MNAIFTVIIQEAGTRQIGSVLVYTDEADAVLEYFAAVQENDDGQVLLYYTQTPGEPAIKLVPQGRPSRGRPWLLN